MMNDKNIDSQSESILLLRTQPFKAADDKNAAHDYNKENVVVCWCQR